MRFRNVFRLLFVVCAISFSGATAAYANHDESLTDLDDLSYSRLVFEHWQKVVIVETILKDEPKNGNGLTDTSSNPESGDKKLIKPYLLKLWFDKGAMGMRHMASGTGFVCGRSEKKILICTNAHVVAGGSKTIVKTASGREYSAIVFVESSEGGPDFAVLAIESEELLLPVTLGDSDKVAIGKVVMAIGHPNDFYYSVSHGIVSGKRSLQETEKAIAHPFFQLDMAVNLGNSGSPLFNMRGEVIGIIESIWKGSQGIAFAVPVNDFKKILEQAKEWIKNQQMPAP